MISVFYDGKCGLCRREIEHYKRIAPLGVFEWVDITTTPAPFTNLGFHVIDGLKILHVRDDDGKIYQGVAAFTVIWRRMPRLWPLLSLLLRVPLMLPLAQKVYTAFAAWRFKKLGYDRCEF